MKNKMEYTCRMCGKNKVRYPGETCGECEQKALQLSRKIKGESMEKCHICGKKTDKLVDGVGPKKHCVDCAVKLKMLKMARYGKSKEESMKTLARELIEKAESVKSLLGIKEDDDKKEDEKEEETKCPECGSTDVEEDDGKYTCKDCKHSWEEKKDKEEEEND